MEQQYKCAFQVSYTITDIEKQDIDEVIRQLAEPDIDFTQIDSTTWEQIKATMRKEFFEYYAAHPEEELSLPNLDTKIQMALSDTYVKQGIIPPALKIGLYHPFKRNLYSITVQISIALITLPAEEHQLFVISSHSEDVIAFFKRELNQTKSKKVFSTAEIVNQTEQGENNGNEEQIKDQKETNSEKK